MAVKTVEEYIGSQDDWAAEIVRELRSIVIESAPGISESIKWAQPVFESNGPFCFIKVHSKHVNFGFWRGVQLEDTKGVLEGTGDKMRHVKLTSLDGIDREVLGDLVKQAVELNAEFGDASRKKGL